MRRASISGRARSPGERGAGVARVRVEGRFPARSLRGADAALVEDQRGEALRDQEQREPQVALAWLGLAAVQHHERGKRTGPFRHEQRAREPHRAVREVSRLGAQRHAREFLFDALLVLPQEAADAPVGLAHDEQAALHGLGHPQGRSERELVLVALGQHPHGAARELDQGRLFRLRRSRKEHERGSLGRAIEPVQLPGRGLGREREQNEGGRGGDHGGLRERPGSSSR